MNKLKTVIKKLNGNVLGIGLSEDLTALIEKNDNITECNLLNSYTKGKFKKSLFNKTIKIKKIRKVFKKKKIDYIICNYDEISNYLNTFVKDSIYINKGKLYFYCNIDVDLLKLKYGRYNVEINLIDKKIIEIDTSSAKNNFFKDFFLFLTFAVHRRPMHFQWRAAPPTACNFVTLRLWGQSDIRRGIGGAVKLHGLQWGNSTA